MFLIGGDGMTGPDGKDATYSDIDINNFPSRQLK
jgi:hypothetical protein